MAVATARTGLPGAWILAVIDHESGRYPCAVSPRGAMGLMQLMPATWAMFQAQLGLGPTAFDVGDNVLAGSFYLRQLYDRFGMVGMLASYSAGAGRYLEAVSSGRPLPAETTAYIAALAPRLRGDGAPAASAAPVADSVFAKVFAWDDAERVSGGGVVDADPESLFVTVSAPEGAP